MKSLLKLLGMAAVIFVTVNVATGVRERNWNVPLWLLLLGLVLSGAAYIWLDQPPRRRSVKRRRG